MAKELKVYGGIFDGSNREIVAAYTKKHAHELISRNRKMSYKSFSDYSSQTGNKKEIEIATADPFTVFKTSYRTFDGVYVRADTEHSIPSP